MGHCTSSTSTRKQKFEKAETVKNLPHKKLDSNIPSEIESNLMKKNIKIALKLEQKLVIDNKEYDITTTFQTLMDEISSLINKQYDYKYTYISNNEEIEFSFYLSETLISKFPFALSSPLKINLTYTGLAISNNVKQFYIDNINIISSPVFPVDLPSNNLSLILFDKTKGLFEVKNIIINDEDINLSVSNFSAYCNMDNKLFISGGMQNETGQNQLTNVFFYINLRTLEIKRLPNLKENRAWHSMIFVPEKYIFIVSGLGSKLVELYDYENGVVEEDSTLNEMRCECSCCVVNNMYLYVFCGYLENFGFLHSIEKSNLRKNKRKWEVVNYKRENDVFFYPSFFPLVNDDSNQKILFLGVNEFDSEVNQEWVKSYIFKYGLENEVIEENKKISIFSGNVFPFKFALPIDNNTNILISLPIAKNAKIYWVNNSGIIEKVLDVKIL